MPGLGGRGSLPPARDLDGGLLPALLQLDAVLAEPHAEAADLDLDVAGAQADHLAAGLQRRHPHLVARLQRAIDRRWAGALRAAAAPAPGSRGATARRAPRPATARARLLPAWPRSRLMPGQLRRARARPPRARAPSSASAWARVSASTSRRASSDLRQPVVQVGGERLGPALAGLGVLLGGQRGLARPLDLGQHRLGFQRLGRDERLGLARRSPAAGPAGGRWRRRWSGPAGRCSAGRSGSASRCRTRRWRWRRRASCARRPSAPSSAWSPAS